MNTFMKTMKWAALMAWLWGIWRAVCAVQPAPAAEGHQGDKPLLLDQDVLKVQGQLAAAFGINEAIIIQKVHEWLMYNERHDKQSHFKDGRWWTYNSYGEWQRDHFA